MVLWRPWCMCGWCQAPECSVGSWRFHTKFYMVQAVPLILVGMLGLLWGTMVALVRGHR